MNILFLGKYNESMHSLEEKILNIHEKSYSKGNDKLQIPTNLQLPEVIKYQIINCTIWVISGDVKPTLLMKDLISKTKIILFIFDFDDLETIEFLIEGWGPIIKKVDKCKLEDQERILIGTHSRRNNYSDGLIRKIEDTIEFLDCKLYFGEGEDLKINKIGDCSILPNLIQYIKDQIPKEIIKISNEYEEENENIEEDTKNKKYYEDKEKIINHSKDDQKIQFTSNDNSIYNLFLIDKTAEIVNMQHLIGYKIIIPTYIYYNNEPYKIANICDGAFQNSNITTLTFSEDSQLKSIGNYAFNQSSIRNLFIPSKLEKLGKYWCVGAENLIQIAVDSNNQYFSNENGFLLYNNGLVSEILFGSKNFIGTLRISHSIGCYAFYKRNDIDRLITKSNARMIDIGDYSFFGTNNLQGIKLDGEEINIGQCSFSNSIGLLKIEIHCLKRLSIGQNSFDNCNRLSTIVIENESEEELKISSNTFQNCMSLINITIKSKSSIILEKETFSEKFMLQKVNISGNNVLLGDKCFNKSFNKNVQFYSYITNSVLIESKSQLEIGNNCFDESYLTKIEIIGEEVKIKKGSFKKCQYLIDFVISRSSILYFEEKSFEDCKNLILNCPIECSFATFEQNAFCGCSKVNKFNIKFMNYFDIWSYYEQIRILKIGKTSNLYLLRRKGTEDLFIAKQLLKKEKYETYIRNFSAHLNLTSKYNNSIISSFFGCGFAIFNSESNECLTIMTKYFVNGSLEDALNKKVLSDTQKYIIILGLTYEMKLLHLSSFNYPNLPPEKILLDENYYPCLNIFGFSNQSEPTIYTAPEVLNKKRSSSHKSDVYSFSLIMYELITGEKLSIKIGDRPDINNIKEESIRNLIQRCWTYNENNRPSFNEIFNEIAKEQFINSFNANKEEISQYIKIIGIPDITEEVALNGISYIISKFNKIAKIIKVRGSNFVFQEFITYESNQYKIVEISSAAFTNSEIKSISIIQNSKDLKIGNFTFESSDQILIFPDKIFRSCIYLKNIKIECSKSLAISNKSFYESTIKSFEVEGNQVEINDECFSSIYLQSLIIKCNELNIGNSCFKNFTSLTEISLCKLTKFKIDISTFSGCRSLKKIRISAKCLEICGFNFNCASELQSIELISDEKLNIKANAFDDCTSLLSILIKIENEEELKIIANMFKNCKSLTNITFISKSSIFIENQTFSKCNQLQQVIISGDRIFLGEKCFYKSFNDTIQNMVQIEANALVEIGRQCFKESFIKTIKIKSNKVHIKKESFSNNMQLSSFIIFDSVEVFIDGFSFIDCSNLTSISLDEIGYCKICSSAFYGCERIKSINLNFTKPFSSLKYYKSKGVFKKNATYKMHLFVQNETHEQYEAKILKDRRKYNEYLKFLSNQMINISKENNTILSNVLECGFFVFGGNPYLTLMSKHFTNETLENVIKTRNFTKIQKYTMLLVITLFMKYLNSRKISHQNLSPKTIIVDNSGQLHFNAFDIVDSSEQTIYNAPEIIQGQPNNKSDVYSFSLIAYELITGQKPTQMNLSNNEFIKKEPILNYLKQCWSPNLIKLPTFSEILVEITKDQYSNYFGNNREIIYKYLSLFGELKLNEFEKISKIGSGSFGEVFLIKNKTSETKFAAKISFETFETDNKSAIRNLQREVIIISKLNHPSILKFIGFSVIDFSKDYKPVIITEYMQNGSLYDIINLERKSQAPYEWNDTKKLINIYGIASAMSYLHLHHIIHRDLKPANILMDQYLFPKIADFGLSKFTQNDESNLINSSSSGIKGTPLYMAPEVISGGEYSTASDVYAFGIIVYEIMTNSIPFKGINQYQISVKVNEGIRPQFDFPIGKYQLLIEQCWSQKPSDRPTFDKILTDLENDQEFLTKNIDPDDYYDFIKYLKNCETTFDTNNSIIPINEYIKRKTETFLPVNIAEQKQLKDDQEHIEEDINDFIKEIPHKGYVYSINDSNKTSKIVKGCEINAKFEFPKYLFYNDKKYDIIEICDEAFSKSLVKQIDSSRLIDITIPPSVVKIGNKCFEKVANIRNVTFLSKDLNIGENCFYKCRFLKSISFPNAQNIIFNSGSFKGCENLYNISISRAEKIELGESCFSYLKRISSIQLECQHLVVGSKCFESCDFLKSFSCKISKITFGSQPFNNCSKLDKVLIKYEPNKTFKSSMDENQNEAIIFNDSFCSKCSLLNYVELDIAQRITVSTFAFDGCNDLSTVKLKSLSSITLINTKSYHKMRITNFQMIGKQVTLDDNCFYSSEILQYLKIECDELQIGNHCFNGCKNLKSVTLEKVKKMKFGSNAFYNCLQLEYCFINTNTKPEIEELYFGHHCFSNCRKLNSIYFSNIQNAKIESHAFEKCDKIIRFNLYVSSKMEIGDYCFYESANLKEVNLSGNDLTAGDFLFYKCNYITSVNLKGMQHQNISPNAYFGIKKKI